MKTKYLIIGQGLAGTLLSFELLKRGEEFIVIDDRQAFSASRVSQGIFTPVYGKRMIAGADIHLYLQKAADSYREIEKLIHEHIYFPQDTYRAFISGEERKETEIFAANPSVKKYLDMNPSPEKNIRAEYAAFLIRETGYVDTTLLINKFEILLEQKKAISHVSFKHSMLRQEKDLSWNYEDINASHIIFCEGYGNISNPFFKHVPFTPSRGMILDISCDSISSKRILKKAVTVNYAGNGIYKAGSTYERDDLSSASDAAARKLLERQLENMLDCRYEVISQRAGMRPSTRDRNPVIGGHHEKKNLFILNGLGSRGVLLAPYFSALLLDHIESGREIPREFNTRRFDKYYTPE